MEEVITEVLTTAAPVAEAVSNADIPTWFVVVMGIGIVFVGLICLIVLISAMGAVMKRVNIMHPVKETAVRTAVPAPAPAAQSAIPNRGELVAAISVALAEELGKDVRAIRIHSIKRV